MQGGLCEPFEVADLGHRRRCWGSPTGPPTTALPRAYTPTRGTRAPAGTPLTEDRTGRKAAHPPLTITVN